MKVLHIPTEQWVARIYKDDAVIIDKEELKLIIEAIEARLGPNHPNSTFSRLREILNEMREVK